MSCALTETAFRLEPSNSARRWRKTVRISERVRRSMTPPVTCSRYSAGTATAAFPPASRIRHHPVRQGKACLGLVLQDGFRQLTSLCFEKTLRYGRLQVE